MLKTILAPAAAMLMLAGCQGDNRETVLNQSAESAATDNMAADNAEATNFAASVLELSDQQRNGVLMRAIYDSKLPCEAVTKSERLEDRNNLPMWRATCNSGEQYLVSVSADGTAEVMNRPQGM